jgi:hypothetical protein
MGGCSTQYMRDSTLGDLTFSAHMPLGTQPHVLSASSPVVVYLGVLGLCACHRALASS